MEALCDLLFELSNDDRLSILFELQKEPMKLSNISKTLDFTPQATSRNLTRLVEVGLIRRNEASEYILTPHGSTSLNLLGPYLFLTENRDYMDTHLTEKLPSEFLARIGDLRNCERVDDPLVMASSMEKVFEESEKWHSYISPFRAASHKSQEHIVNKLDSGVVMRNIEETDYFVPDRTLSIIPKEEMHRLEYHWRNGIYEYRYLDKINIRINMSEKEVSILTFPKIDGKVDLLGFTSSDPKFHSWCKDIFDFYWEIAKAKTTLWTQSNLETE